MTDVTFGGRNIAKIFPSSEQSGTFGECALQLSNNRIGFGGMLFSVLKRRTCEQHSEFESSSILVE